ncbi:MAG: tetratricopeptide repeat protein [candidate division Zixibacteria bacterium]|nr:tetratricopeptide repeat protein [candidate division Zixibacteria bacterium]
MKSKIIQDKKELYFLFGIFVFSFVLRLIYLSQMNSNPYFTSPTMDALYHDLWAQAIVQGNWIGDQVFFRAPFYPYFLGIICKLLGHNYFIPRLIQHLIGSLSVILIYFLARKLFNRKVATLSAILTSIYGVLIYYEDELLLDFLLVFFGVLLLLLLYRAEEKSKSSRFFTAGLVASLFAITRPNILIFIPFVLVWILLLLKVNLKRKIVFSLFFLMGLFGLILPITVRNYLVGKDFVLISSQGGINFYIGNNPQADGTSAILPPYGDDWEYQDAAYEVQGSIGKIPRPSEVSDYYLKKGTNFIIRSPQKFLSLFLKKAYLFWNSFEISNNQDIYFFRRYSALIRILPVGFWIIGPLSLVGILLSLKSWRKYFLVLIFVLSYSFSVLLFFVNSRFRLPVLPFLIVLSSFALIQLFGYLKGSSFKKLFLSMALLVLFFFLCNSNLYHLDKTNFAQSYFSLGNLFLKKGNLQDARAEYLLALKENPSLQRAHLNLGNIYFHQKDYSRAEKEFLEELKANPRQEKAYNNLSVLYRIQGDDLKATTLAKQALEIKPYYKEAYVNLALAYLKTENYLSAESSLVSALALFPSFAELRFYLGLVYQKQGKSGQALREYMQLMSQKPETQDLEYNLGLIYSKDDPSQEGLNGLRAYAAYNSGLIYLQQKEIDPAQENLIQSIKLKPDFAEAHAILGNLYDLRREYEPAVKELEEAIKDSPDNLVYHYNLGLILAKTKNFPLAKQEFETALRLSPDFKLAQEKLRLVDSLLSIQSSK